MAEKIESFLDILQKPFEWPMEGDKLFLEEDSWWRKTEIASDVLSRLVLMWDGYKRAGDALVEYSDRDEAGRIDRNTLVYPIMFCYRHSVELALKWFLLMYGGYAGVEPNLKDHSLTTLWKSCRATINRIDPEPHPEDQASRDAVDALIQELDKADPQSFAFRYATDTAGRLVLLKTKDFSFSHLAKKMDALQNYFKGLDGHLDHLVSAGP